MDTNKPKTTRAKIRCALVEQEKDNDGKVYSVQWNFHGVFSGAPENAVFFKSTPILALHMHVDNPAAFEMFKPDDEIYMDLTLASRKEPTP